MATFDQSVNCAWHLSCMNNQISCSIYSSYVPINTLCMIFYLFKENEKPNSFGYHGWSDNYKKLYVKPAAKCNCLNCRLNRFEYSSVM